MDDDDEIQAKPRLDSQTDVAEDRVLSFQTLVVPVSYKVRDNPPLN